MTFIEVGGLTTEDEVLPCWDGLDHDGRVVPAGDIVVDIWNGPLLGVHVPKHNIVILGFTVPATV